MNQQSEQDQGFDQEPAPVAANGSSGSGKASAAMAMSVLALAGTGYNWYDANSSKSSVGEQTSIDYSSQIQSLEEQIQSITESQEKFASMAASTQSTEASAGVTETESEQVSEASTTEAETETESGQVSEASMAEAETETESEQVNEASMAEAETETESGQVSEEASTTEAATETESEQVSEASTAEAETETESEQVSEASTAEADTETESEQVSEASTAADITVASTPNSDEIKQIAMQQVDAVLTQAKKRLGLNEVAQLLSIGEQRLALAGDVTGAQAAFGIASERLSAFSDPLIDPVRESVTANIESLNAVDVIDKTTLTQDLGSLAGAVDGLAFKPLETLAEQAPTQEAVEESTAEEDNAQTAAPSDSGEGLSLEGAGSLLKTWGSKLGDTIGDVGTGIAGDLKDMVRIKKTGPLSDVVLAPEQEYFIRENMKLTLGGAQRAVLQGNGGVYQQNLTQVQSLLGEFFDGDNEDVQSVAGRLTELAQVNLEPELPDISNSSASLSDVLKQLASTDSSDN